MSRIKIDADSAKPYFFSLTRDDNYWMVGTDQSIIASASYGEAILHPELCQFWLAGALPFDGIHYVILTNDRTGQLGVENNRLQVVGGNSFTYIKKQPSGDVSLIEFKHNGRSLFTGENNQIQERSDASTEGSWYYMFPLFHE